jgi:hypothetical protein
MATVKKTTIEMPITKTISARMLKRLAHKGFRFVCSLFICRIPFITEKKKFLLIHIVNKARIISNKPILLSLVISSIIDVILFESIKIADKSKYETIESTDVCNILIKIIKMIIAMGKTEIKKANAQAEEYVKRLFSKNRELVI